MNENENEVRMAARSLYDNITTNRSRFPHTTVELSRSHSVNLITEEFLAGFTQDGRMSTVRRFFCLFVTFDLFFVALLWLIVIMINGDNIYNALKTQVLHYTIYTSLFDVVIAAIFRFIILLFFYALLYINHWIIIALSTTGSCMFLISKVFVYNWVASSQPVFQVVLILASFILAWGETWFLDCRVIPQERRARNYFHAISATQPTERSPLISPLLATEGPPTNTLSFYSPYYSIHNSDDEDDQQDEEYKNMGIECVRQAYNILEHSDWKVETVTSKDDTIQSTQREKLGKIYRLTGRVHYPAKQLLEELFYKIENVPKWNPTLLESKIVKKIDTHTDISYQATVGGGGGLVKCRDFVNLRCWRLYKNGTIIMDDDEDVTDDDEDNDESGVDRSCEGSVSTLSDVDDNFRHSDGVLRSNSVASILNEKKDQVNNTPSSSIFKSLSKSLGAKDFHANLNINTEPPPLLDNESIKDEYKDAENNFKNSTEGESKQNKKLIDKIYISAAVSVAYPGVPENPKYTRGQNLISCWAMREIAGKPDHCIFDWILCLDLKGYIPKYVIDSACRSLMQDYMLYLRKYCKELRQKRRKVPHRIKV